jgi:phenylpropionate dioxygenase-like ring-hydroxylating dioxygenase large terminal subunit
MTMVGKPYLKNAWYVAAWSNEIGRSLFSRTLLEQPILLYRKANGEAVAISNVCAHRFAPLHMGKLVGDAVQCPYHGLQYDGSGRCTLNPHGDGMIPPRMAVATYPLVERHGMIWLWMGDQDQQDPSKIPDFSCHVDPELKRVSGVIEMKANYELISDNLLDLAHAEFVHEGILSSEAITRSKLQTIQNGTTIYANRWCPKGAPAPAWDGLLEGRPAEVDHWLYMRWDAPANMLLDAGVTRVGDTRARGAWVYGTDILVPKDQYTTYYFWAVTRAYALEDAAADEMWKMSIKGAFEGQDQVIIEAQQRMMGTRTLEECEPVMLAIDSGAQRARKLLAKLIAEQAAPTPNNPQLADQRRATDPTHSPVQPAV